MEQGTTAWHEFRSLGIGGSDVPSVMGINPYKSAYKLWHEKTRLITADLTENFAMHRGTRNEPKARSHIELMTGKAWAPDLVVDSQKSYLRVSLDGRSGDEILEIKVPSEALVLGVEARGIEAIPDHHMVQMQYQLRVTGAVRCLYVVFHPESDKIVTCWVPRDDLKIKIIETAVDYFWDCVVTKVQPGPLPFIELAQKYKKLIAQAKALESEIEEIKKELLTYAPIQAGGLKITSYEVKGAIDYSKVEGDFEAFRKPSRTQFKITIEKDG